MIACYARKRSSRDTAMTRLAASNRAAAKAAVDALAARGMLVSATSVAREAGLRLPAATGHLAALRREGLAPPPPKGGGAEWADRTDRALAALARLAARGLPATKHTFAAETGLTPKQAANLLSRLRAAGLVPKIRRSTPIAPARPPASTVWPEGRPEAWDAAMACRWYVREWRRMRRPA